MAPACANACPEGAISIEIVNVAEWRRDYVAANAPGLPSADDSISTTRITLPADLPPDTGRVDTNRIDLEHPHWPLVFMLVLTQLSVGAFSMLWILDSFSAAQNLVTAAVVSLTLAGLSLGASTFHLGRPIYAFRALKGLRRSWLSREVLTLSIFAGAASAYAGMLFLDLPGRFAMGALTAFAGAVGVTCSAKIYVVRARPAWNGGYTLAEFYSTALLLGPLFVLLLEPGAAPWVKSAVAAGAAAQLGTQILKYMWLTRSEVFELRACALLLSGRLRKLFLTRLALLLVAGILLPLQAAGAPVLAAAALLALTGEWLGRYLFFVSVVPKNMATAFSVAGKAAA
jgi:DMSO reductase anchor subunit